MLTSDLALRYDPAYKNISQTFLDDFDYFTEKFALAWCTYMAYLGKISLLANNNTPDKLLHRDMGPLSRYLGPDVPQKEPLIWQDPLPAGKNTTLSPDDIAQLKNDIMGESCLNVSNLITTAWGSASTFRYSDKRGGANGARIALEPQVSFQANNPMRLKTVLDAVGHHLERDHCLCMLTDSSF